MAAVPVSPDIKRLSFAKVAASASLKDSGPVPTSLPPRPPVTVPNLAKARRDQHQQPQQYMPTSFAAAARPRIPNGGANTAASARAIPSRPMQIGQIPLRTVPAALPRMSSTEGRTAEEPKTANGERLQDRVVNGSSTPERPKEGPSSQPPADEASQKADSSSETGTKPPSLDGKSITSGTTFAMDEKESLRPDDSASVKAAVEDDDSFSVRGSLPAGSRMGSDLAQRVYRIQLGDMPEQHIIQSVSETPSQGVITPQSSSSDHAPQEEASIPLASVTDADGFNAIYRQAPDEKLLDAMLIPKDRLFLLRLEKDVVDFVLSSKEPFMDLAPCNAFCRMLTHKLADYYHMTHSYEGATGSVRIFRTPFCRVPPSLANVAAPTPNSGTPPPPPVLPKKIMRRGEDGQTVPSSASPSKPTSEAGSDKDKDKAPPVKEKPTREEREEAYNRARERIFGSVEKTGESTPDEDANGVSRASSVSARDKSLLGKRGKNAKQRRDDSESFDSRSQYTAYYTNPQQPTWTPQYIPMANQQFAGPVQQPPYQGPMAPVYSPAGQAYQPQMMPANGFAPYNAMPTYPPQPTPPRYQAPPTPMAPAYVPAMQSAPPQQAWTGGYVAPQAPYTPRAPAATPVGIPYAYGQLPVNVNPNDPKSQHPIPGSYNRHAFNPKTQSFVPGNPAMMGIPVPPLMPVPPLPQQQQVVVPQQPQQQQPPQYQPGPPQHGSPQMAFNSYQGPPPPLQQPQVHQQPPAYPRGPANYGMNRQSMGGAGSVPPPYHNNAHLAQPPPPQQQQVLHHQGPQRGPAPQHHVPHHGPNKPSIPLGPAAMNNSNNSNSNNGGSNNATPTFSHLPNYGNVATLPQKPPKTGV